MTKRKQRPPKDQHVVSQVLLERFTNPAGELLVYLTRTGQELSLAPKVAGVVKSFIRRDPLDSERLWQTVERRLPEVFSALDADELLGDVDLEDTVREAMALHWARSKMLREVWDLAGRRVLERVVAEAPDALAREFRRRHHGLLPAGREALLIAAEEVSAPTRVELRDADTLRDRVHHHFDAMRERLAQYAIEISHAHEGEFLMSDSPVVLLPREGIGVGPLGGVTIEKARTIAMPLGPFHFASVGRERARIEFDARTVRSMNSAQIGQSFDQLFYRPGSGLYEQLVEIRELQAFM